MYHHGQELLSRQLTMDRVFRVLYNGHDSSISRGVILSESCSDIISEG